LIKLAVVCFEEMGVPRGMKCFFFVGDGTAGLGLLVDMFGALLVGVVGSGVWCDVGCCLIV
jgi:hypothetical protein